MIDIDNNDCNSRTPEQLRRRVRGWYTSPATQRAMRDAVLCVPGTTIFDQERIATQFAGCLNSFLHLDHFKTFRACAVAWCAHQAEMTAILRGHLTEIRGAVLAVEGVSPVDAITASAMIFRKLPSYTGAVEDSELVAWAIELATHIARSAATMWVRWTKVESDVYGGIGKVLAECRDFETPTELQDIADHLALDVMAYFMGHHYEFSDDIATLAKQLNTRGYNAARAWKSDCLYALKKGDRRKPVQSLDVEGAQVLDLKRRSGRDQVLSKALPIRFGENDNPYGTLTKKELRVDSWDVPMEYLAPLPKRRDDDKLSVEPNEDNTHQKVCDEPLPLAA